MKYRKRFSQNLLINQFILREIAEVIDIGGKEILEIGAGTGLLTRELVKKAKKVFAVEIDERMIPKLRENTAEFNNIKIIQGDALSLDFSPYKTIFGNLPYHLSSPLLFRIIESNFEEAVLCLQKEFAERIVATPGSHEYSRLSVMVQSNCDPKIIRFISKNSFFPKPRVDSAVIHLKKNKKFRLDPALINGIFMHKNKTLRNALVDSRKFLGKTKEEMLEFAASLEFSGKKVKEMELSELEIASAQYARLQG